MNRKLVGALFVATLVVSGWASPGEYAAAGVSSRAQNLSEPCGTVTPDSSSVFYVNGVDNDWKQAKFSADKLATSLGLEFGQVQVMHNPTSGLPGATGVLPDLVEFLDQKLQQQVNQGLVTVEMASDILSKASRTTVKVATAPSRAIASLVAKIPIEKVNEFASAYPTLLDDIDTWMGERGEGVSSWIGDIRQQFDTALLLPETQRRVGEFIAAATTDLEAGKTVSMVAHSQGNLFATSVFDELSSQYQGLSVTHVAPPTTQLRGPHILIDTDLVITALAGSVGSVPSTNVQMPAFKHGSNHDFVKAYLDTESDSPGLLATAVGAASIEICDGVVQYASPDRSYMYRTWPLRNGRWLIAETAHDPNETQYRIIDSEGNVTRSWIDGQPRGIASLEDGTVFSTNLHETSVSIRKVLPDGTMTVRHVSREGQGVIGQEALELGADGKLYWWSVANGGYLLQLDPNTLEVVGRASISGDGYLIVNSAGVIGIETSALVTTFVAYSSFGSGSEVVTIPPSSSPRRQTIYPQIWAFDTDGGIAGVDRPGGFSSAAGCSLGMDYRRHDGVYWEANLGSFIAESASPLCRVLDADAIGQNTVVLTIEVDGELRWIWIKDGAKVHERRYAVPNPYSINVESRADRSGRLYTVLTQLLECASSIPASPPFNRCSEVRVLAWTASGNQLANLTTRSPGQAVVSWGFTVGNGSFLMPVWHSPEPHGCGWDSCVPVDATLSFVRYGAFADGAVSTSGI